MTTGLEDKREEMEKMKQLHRSSSLALLNVNGDRMEQEAVLRKQESMLREAVDAARMLADGRRRATLP